MDAVERRLTSNDCDNLVDVVLIVGNTVVCDREFSVRGLGMAITIRKIVNDNFNQVVASGSSGSGQDALESLRIRQQP